MDPLFGFIDDISVQHQVDNNAGEYTISYPTDQSEQYQLQHSNTQHGNSSETTGQVVHVVSENSQNEKQIYVIKLENFLKDEGNPDDTTVKFEGADPDQGTSMDIKPDMRGLNETSSDGSSTEDENDGAKSQDESEAAETGPDPFLV